MIYHTSLLSKPTREETSKPCLELDYMPGKAQNDKTVIEVGSILSSVIFQTDCSFFSFSDIILEDMPWCGRLLYHTSLLSKPTREETQMQTLELSYEPGVAEGDRATIDVLRVDNAHVY